MRKCWLCVRCDSFQQALLIVGGFINVPWMNVEDLLSSRRHANPALRTESVSSAKRNEMRRERHAETRIGYLCNTSGVVRLSSVFGAESRFCVATINKQTAFCLRSGLSVPIGQHGGFRKVPICGERQHVSAVVIQRMLYF